MWFATQAVSAIASISAAATHSSTTACRIYTPVNCLLITAEPDPQSGVTVAQNPETDLPVLNDVVESGNESIIQSSRLGREVLRELEALRHIW